MRLDGERIVIETVADGIVAADAAAIGIGDRMAEYYRTLDPQDLPVTMGKSTTADVINGFRKVIEFNIPSAKVSRGEALAYLAELGIDS